MASITRGKQKRVERDEKMKSGKTARGREEKSNYSLCFTCHRRSERALIFYPCLQVTTAAVAGRARTRTCSLARARMYAQAGESVASTAAFRSRAAPRVLSQTPESIKKKK